MLSKLITFTLITSLLAAPSPAKEATNADVEGLDLGLDGLFGLADLGDIAGGGDTEITHETRDEEEIGFNFNQIIEELEETGDNEEEDLFGRRIVELEEEEEEEEETQPTTRADSGEDNSTESTEGSDTTTEEVDSKKDEDNDKYKGKGHNYKHKKMEE